MDYEEVDALEVDHYRHQYLYREEEEVVDVAVVKEEEEVVVVEEEEVMAEAMYQYMANRE